jgi:hypothetical protein
MKKFDNRTKQFRLNVDNISKIIDGKKYHCNGIVPESMKDDLYRTFNKHGLVLKVEPDEYDKDKIKIWTRTR